MAGSTPVELTDRLPRPARADDALTLLQAVADPVRWAVLTALAGGPLCVCGIQERVPVAGNLLSYHLKVLRASALVTTTRRGRWVDYALAEDARTRPVAALSCSSSASSSS